MHISHSLTGVDATAFVSTGHGFHHAGDLMGGPTTPYVIHLGGTGASYVGVGGAGHANTSVSPTYVSQTGVDLLGGSGGGCGGQLPLSAMRQGRLTSGLGGHGGGVIEIVAMNDFTVGPEAVFTANGYPGYDAFRAGGGGSGGTIYLPLGDQYGLMAICVQMVAMEV